MIKVLLDTDIGGDIDDAVCLAYLLKEPQCDLIGITTVCGNPEIRASVADAICKAAGKQIPIVAGLDRTMSPVPVYPTPGGAGALTFWEHDIYQKSDAPTFLYQKIKENPREIMLIGSGNMTNIATLFSRYPESARLLRGLHVMNGYFGAEPLPDPYYNWNSWADPLASKIVFSTRISINRAIPLEVTDTLSIEASQAERLLKPNSNLMNAVYAFGDDWLKKSAKLTLHDPLAAVSVFHPDICRFERGDVQVETEAINNMGGTSFAPSEDGCVEIARTVDRVRFYRILHHTLCESRTEGTSRTLPPQVVSRAESVGIPGEVWLAGLDDSIADLEVQWHISVGKALPGGSHAFVAYADGENGEKYVLKIDMPEDLGGDFTCGMAALRTADGNGYVKLYAHDPERKACLLERLGKPISRLGYSVDKQLRIICQTLQEAWKTPVGNTKLAIGNTVWFEEFIGETYEKLNHPCSKKVIKQVFSYLNSRAADENADEFVLIHGDAHSGNILETLNGESFKLIDPDGLIYEKAYDLGVLMREWVEDYEHKPLENGRQRCAYLHRLTGVSEQAIWEWGYIQTVSTAFVLLQTGQEELGRKMLYVAEKWVEDANQLD